MSAHSVTLHLPDSLYDHFRGQAQLARRSLEAELLQIVRAAAPADEACPDEELPEDLALAIQDLEVLDDEALWNAARAQLPDEARARFDALNFKRQSEGLTSSEQAEQEHLLHQSDRMMLVRAHACRLLGERGHDVSSLLER